MDTTSSENLLTQAIFIANLRHEKVVRFILDSLTLAGIDSPHIAEHIIQKFIVLSRSVDGEMLDCIVRRSKLVIAICMSQTLYPGEYHSSSPNVSQVFNFFGCGEE